MRRVAETWRQSTWECTHSCVVTTLRAFTTATPYRINVSVTIDVQYGNGVSPTTCRVNRRFCEARRAHSVASKPLYVVGTTWGGGEVRRRTTD